MEKTTLDQEQKVLDLVVAMNNIGGLIEDGYDKISILTKTGEGNDAKFVRYFIKQRPVTNDNGIQSWKFVARIGQ